MTDNDLEAYMDAAGPLLGLTLDPAWRDAIRANLAVTWRMGQMVLDFPLPDDADPAPIFQA